MNEAMKYYTVRLCLLTIGDEILTEFSALTGIIHLVLLLRAVTPYLALQETLKALSLIGWAST